LKKFTIAISKMLANRTRRVSLCRRGARIESGTSTSKTSNGAAQTGPIVKRGGSVM
jgi:hypothetical protein